MARRSKKKAPAKSTGGQTATPETGIFSPGSISRRAAIFAIVTGAIGVLTLVGKLSGFLGWLFGLTFCYPVELSQVRQFQTDAGYVLHFQIRSTNSTTIYIPRDRFQVEVKHVDSIMESMSVEDRAKLIHGEAVKVFDNVQVLDAAIEGRDYANANVEIACVGEPRDLYMLVTVAGPGGSNPSMTFQAGRVYKSIGINIRKRILSVEYLDVPLNHIPIVADDKNTRIIEK